jgi:hypothetical protein
MSRLGVRLSAAEHDELMGRVDAFLQELAARRPTSGGRPYSLFFALHEDAGRLPRAGGGGAGSGAGDDGGRATAPGREGRAAADR